MTQEVISGGVLRDALHGLIAQTAQTTADPANANPLSAWWVPLIPVGFLMYFLIIRPQQQQQKQQQDTLSKLKKGDEVLLQGGIFGKIFEVRPDDLIVELAPGVKVRVLKSAVTTPAPAAGAKADAKVETKEAEKKT